MQKVNLQSLGSRLPLLLQMCVCAFQGFLLLLFDRVFAPYMPHIFDDRPYHPRAGFFEFWSFAFPGFAQWIFVPLGIWLAYRGSKEKKDSAQAITACHIVLCFLSWYFCFVSLRLSLMAWD